MFIVKLATAGLLGMVAVSALAQAPPMDTPAAVGTGIRHGDSDAPPKSDRASNIAPSGTSGTNAPILPKSALGLDATSRAYLRSARASLVAGKTGKAQQSLE